MSTAFPINVYLGDTDLDNCRNGIGREYWKHSTTHCQTYKGQFHNDTFHGTGAYTLRNKGEKHKYRGKFYANKFEGYGSLTHTNPNQSVFEGLFRANKRYGPGVMTYENGRQDVGFWNGLYLIRLSQVLKEKMVPKLAETSKGKVYLLRFKKLVDVSFKYEEEAKNVLKEMNRGDGFENEELYSKFVRNPNSLFFNQKSYYEHYFVQNEPDLIIDVIDSYDLNNNPILKQIQVTHLIAWNNEPLLITIMAHVFKQRNFENLLTYNVNDILTGTRERFNEPGVLEASSLILLEQCCGGDERIVSILITRFDLYPDVSDLQGNSGVMYASANDNGEVIRTLVNFGANPDLMNDECLTPLLLSILRFIACKYDAINWELAFLSLKLEFELPEAEVQLWRKSLHSDLNVNMNTKNAQTQKFLLDLSCIRPKVGKKSKKKQKKLKNKKSILKNEPLNESKQILLNTIQNTILTLLECKSNVNFGHVPFPPLILTLFAKDPDLLHSLITFGANCNIRTSYQDGYLTPLHVLVSLEPSSELIEQATILLEHGSVPDLRSGTNHWNEEKERILSRYENVEDFGKTALHLLSMRYDFLNDPDDFLGQLWSVLMFHGSSLKLTYLGHTTLTLALLRGNIRLITRILESGANPNEKLEYKMGLPVTVLILKRYKNILRVGECKNVFNILLKYGANPLNDCPEFEGNCVEFSREENMKKVRKKEKLSRSPALKLFNNCAEQTLIRHLQSVVVKSLYLYKIECGMNEAIFEAIVKFLNVDTTFRILQLLIQTDQIFPSRQFCFELLQYVNAHGGDGGEKKKRKKRKKKKREIKNFLEKMIMNLDVQTRVEYKFPLPEIDPDQYKYKVCFQCFAKTNKELMRCPKCELVYFCSQKCNNLSLKSMKHPCRISFYDSELKKKLERIKNGEIYESLNQFERFRLRREELIKNDANYFNKLLKRDHFDEIIKKIEMEELKRKKREKTKRKKKDKDSKGRRTGRSKTKSDEFSVSTKRTKSSKSKDSEKSKRIKKGKSSKKELDEDSEDAKFKTKRKDKDSKGRRRGRSKTESSESEDEDLKERSRSRKRKSGKDKESAKRKHKKQGSKFDKDQKQVEDQSTSQKHKKITTDSKESITKEIDGKTEMEEKRNLPDKRQIDSTELEINVDKKLEEITQSEEQELSRDNKAEIMDTCHSFDYNFYQMLMPYCVLCIDGQFYYKFNKQNIFCKMTHSNV